MSRALFLVILIQFLGISLNALFYYPTAIYKKVGYPFGTPLFKDDDSFDEIQGMQVAGPHVFGDYAVAYLSTKKGSPYYADENNKTTSNYFPTTHLLLKPFSYLPYATSLVMFFAVFLFLNSVLFFILLNRLPIPERAGFSLFFGVFNYANYLAIDRGNIEVMVLTFVLLWLIFYERKKYEWSAFFLGVAASIKPFPALFAFLFFSRKDYRSLLTFFASSCLLTVVGAWAFEGGLIYNLKGLLINLQGFGRSVSVGGGAVRLGSSFFGLFKGIYFAFYNLKDTSWTYIFGYPFKWIAEVYFLIVPAFLFYFLKKLKRVEFEHWEELFVLAAFMILLPKTSYDYRLVYLLVPFVALVQKASSHSASHLNIFAIILSVILLPKAFFVHDFGLGVFLTISVVLNPLLLMWGLRLIDKKEGPSLLLKT